MSTPTCLCKWLLLQSVLGSVAADSRGHARRRIEVHQQPLNPSLGLCNPLTSKVVRGSYSGLTTVISFFIPAGDLAGAQRTMVLPLLPIVRELVAFKEAVLSITLCRERRLSLRQVTLSTDSITISPENLHTPIKTSFLSSHRTWLQDTGHLAMLHTT